MSACFWNAAVPPDFSARGDYASLHTVLTEEERTIERVRNEWCNDDDGFWHSVLHASDDVVRAMTANVILSRPQERFELPGPSEDEHFPNYWSADVEKRRHMSQCAGCQQEINDRFILRVHPNMEFHAHCLKCVECCRFLDESNTAFVRDGRTYCKNDYFRLFGTKCAGCAQPFHRSELVMRARHLTFHTHCFACVACRARLNTGDQYFVKADSLLCRVDCDGGMAHERASATPSASMFADEESWETSTMTSLDPPAASPSLSARSPKSDEVVNYHSTPPSGGVKKSKKDKQTTRVRTVLNENQLLILKKCYNLNSRPDALLKEQLVEMTGLNARVIRVWFQNKRCKDKKRQIQMRDYQINAEKERTLTNARLSGVGPLITPPSVNHVDPNGPAMDVVSYPQWDDAYQQTPIVPQQQMNYTELGYAMPPPPPQPFQEYSPHLHASDLSSPSCSE